MQKNNPKKWEKDCIKTRRSLWLRKRRLKQFEIRKTDKILELGCGDGLNIKILRSLGINYIIGIDISKFLLKLAKKNNPNVKFILASAENLPFKDNQFDIILADSVLYHLIDSAQSFSEIKRILKKGGKICFIEAHQSVLRRILDIITLSPLAKFLPFFKGRKSAFLAERDLIDYWLKNENRLPILLNERGFKKIFLKRDFLSIIGEYGKI